MRSMGLILIILGAVLILIGLFWLAGERWSWWGRLPGDIRVEGQRFTFYAPLATCLVLSLLITIILNIILRVFFRPPL